MIIFRSLLSNRLDPTVTGQIVSISVHFVFVVATRLGIGLLLLLIGSLPFPLAQTIDELDEIGGTLGLPYERMSQEFFGRRPIRRILLQAHFDEVLEEAREVALQLGRRVLGNLQEHPHGMQVGIGRLAFGQLVGRDAQRPDVRLEVVGVLFDDLGRHPKRSAHKRVALAHGLGELFGHAEIS